MTLDVKDVQNPTAIEEAVVEALDLPRIRARREEFQASYDHVSRYYLPHADQTFRPTSREPGAVRFKVTREVAETLELEIDDTRGIKQHLEDHLYRLYSNIDALRPPPDKVGIAWGNRNYGRHLHAFENVSPEEATAAQQRFERDFPLRNLSSKQLGLARNKAYSN